MNPVLQHLQKMMRKFLQLFLTLILILWICSPVMSRPRARFDARQLDRYYTQMVKDWEVPGMVVGIVKDGELIFTGSYGVLEEGKPGKPDAHTLYGIASISKAFTSMVMAMLVEEGKLNWDDKVVDYLPYFELYDPWVSSQVTIRDILSHRVGLGTFSGDVIWYKSDFSAEEIIRLARHVPKAREFRSEYGYSNLMYITAGEVIRVVTGKSWSENVKERIFEPLGMSRSLTSPKDIAAMDNFCTPHAREDGVNIPIEWEDWEEIGATGGIISSVNDLAKWMIFNLNHGTIDGKSLITARNRNIMWTPHVSFTVDHTRPNEFNQRFSTYGLGWGLGQYKGRMRVSHTGAIDGMLTALHLIPEENMGVVVLTNGMQTPMMAATYSAIDRVLGLETPDWSSIMLERTLARQSGDKRTDNIKNSRVLNTSPSVSPEKVAGTYKSDIHGEIYITYENNELKMLFERSRHLGATLRHWHYDVWEIVWDEKHAWFNLGTVKFNTDNNLVVKGMDFEVPNDDIFFEELKPYKVK
jgi:CubicO group peptidase (beta-lactamase class C family)